MSRRGIIVRVTLLVLVIAGGLVYQQVVGLPSRSELRSSLDDLGAAAVPTFIVLYMLCTAVPTIPKAFLTIAAGAFFALPVALAAVYAGAMLGAALAFLIARRLGGDVVRQVSNERVRDLDHRVRERGFAAVLVARLIPLIPFTAANYAFGLTSVTWQSYLTATGIGIVPGTVLYVLVGAYGTEPGSWPFAIAVGGLVLLSVAGLVRARRNRHGRRVSGRDPSSDAEDPPERP